MAKACCDIEHVRELLSKDITYIKEKVDSIVNKIDIIDSSTQENNMFRLKFKWTAAMITTISAIIGFTLSIAAFKLKFF